MAGITLDTGRCVRTLSKFGSCEACVNACPTSAIKLDEHLPSLNLATCVGCGGCVGICPTEALQLDDFSPLEFFFSFVQESDNVLSCRKNVPCISVLHVEYVIALAVLKKGIVFDMGHCEECDIAATCKAQIVQCAEEANYVLEAMECEQSVQLEAVAYDHTDSKTPTSERRDFFKNINLKNAAQARAQFERNVEIATDEYIQSALSTEQIATMREKTLSDKRKILFTALKRLEKPLQYHVVEALSFTSQKLLEQATCTACQICYRICPTGALSSDARNSKIDFDPFMCVKCGLCHDVCESDALRLSPSYNIKELFEPSLQRLVNFSVKTCNECATPFVSLHGETLCMRCAHEEDAAHELWGISHE